MIASHQMLLTNQMTDFNANQQQQQQLDNAIVAAAQMTTAAVLAAANFENQGAFQDELDQHSLMILNNHNHNHHLHSEEEDEEEEEDDFEGELRMCSVANCNGYQKRSWYKSKINVGANLCQNCYKRERLTLSHRECNNCRTPETHSDWYRSKITKGAYLCDKCYYIELLQVQNRACCDCGTTKTSIAWSKSKDNRGSSFAKNVTLRRNSS